MLLSIETKINNFLNDRGVRTNCLMLLLSCVILQGCFFLSQENLYLKNYISQDISENEYIKIMPKEIPIIIEPMAKKGTLETTKLNLIKKGYVVIGTSSFKGAWGPRSLALETAIEKGASVVIIVPRMLSGKKDFCQRYQGCPYSQEENDDEYLHVNFVDDVQTDVLFLARRK